MTSTTHEQRHDAMADREMARCIDLCDECSGACAETLRHCLGKGGKHAAVEHVATLLGCAEMCATSARFMRWRLDLHRETCRVCAEVCLRCADSCEALAEDGAMRRCADVCRRCAAECGAMAGVVAA